jgi:hypothetical protein
MTTVLPLEVKINIANGIYFNENAEKQGIKPAS